MKRKIVCSYVFCFYFFLFAANSRHLFHLMSFFLFQTFAVFGTLCLFHLHKRVGMKNSSYLYAGELPRRKHTTYWVFYTCPFLIPCGLSAGCNHLSTHLSLPLLFLLVRDWLLAVLLLYCITVMKSEFSYMQEISNFYHFKNLRTFGIGGIPGQAL